MTEQDNSHRISPKNIVITPEDREHFRDLKQKLNKEASYVDMWRMLNGPASLKIVSMGQIAIPLILEDISIEPSWIFMILYRLTGTEDQIQSSNELDFDGEINHWKKWGEEEGYPKPLEQKPKEE